jgi:transposase
VSRSARYRKLALHEQARILRREGRSLRTIASTVVVSLSTVSLWVRDIELPETQRAALEAANPALSGRRTGQLAWSRICREERAKAQAHGRGVARAGNPLHQAGCML